MDAPRILAIWLHTLALVIAWGYYGILGRVILPALERSLDRRASAAALAAIERRAAPLVLLSVILFTVSGTYLLVVDSHYAGLGNFFASSWTALMLVKHGFVVAFVVLAVVVDMLVRRIADATTRTAGDERGDAGTAERRWLGVSAEAATAMGALITLLTAVAQVSA